MPFVWETGKNHDSISMVITPEWIVLFQAGIVYGLYLM